MGRRPTQVQLTDELLAILDTRAASTGRSRSDLIRQAIVQHFAEAREAEIDRRIVEAYTRIPQEEISWPDDGVVGAILQEPS